MLCCGEEEIRLYLVYTYFTALEYPAIVYSYQRTFSEEGLSNDPFSMLRGCLVQVG